MRNACLCLRLPQHGTDLRVFRRHKVHNCLPVLVLDPTRDQPRTISPHPTSSICAKVAAGRGLTWCLRQPRASWKRHPAGALRCLFGERGGGASLSRCGSAGPHRSHRTRGGARGSRGIHWTHLGQTVRILSVREDGARGYSRVVQSWHVGTGEAARK